MAKTPKNRVTVEIRGKQVEVDRPGTSQCLLILFNLLIFLVGVGLTCFGMTFVHKPWTKKAIKFIGKSGLPAMMINVINNIMTEYKVLGKVFIIFGGTVSIISFLGCCGAWCSKSLLSIYRLIMVTLVVLIAAGGYVTVEQTGKVMPLVVNQFVKFFPMYHSDPIAATALNKVMGSLQCCGVFGPDDWLEDGVLYNSDLATTGTSAANANGETPGSAIVPDGCCLNQEVGCGAINNNSFENENKQMLLKMLGKKQQNLDMLKQKFKTDAQKEIDNYDPQVLQDLFEKVMKAPEGMEDLEKHVDPNAEKDWADYGSDMAMVRRKRFSTSSEAIAAYGRFARFASNQDMPDNLRDQHIFKWGCATKFGNILVRKREDLIVMFVVLAIPEVICIILASRVLNYFEELEE